LDSFLEALRRGESRSLVIRGEAGVGKTALLEYLAGRAADGRVIGVTAVQSEMELAFAALHQLCAPILDELEGLPAPQREALRITFGLHDGPVPDRFLVGLAVLSVLAEAAADRPLVCVVDDAQWLDRASAQVLAFVARRLGMESVGLVFAARVSAEELAGLPQLVIEGLKGPDARALLDRVLTGPVDIRVREEIIAETGGNPLALVELPRGLTPGELAGGFGLPGVLALPGRIEETFQRRISALPADTRRLLLLAAAEPLGEPLLVWRAADNLGIDREAANPAVDAGLVLFGARVRFRHPLVRSAVYRLASAHERQEAHRALAEVTDPVRDPDRRAWHRAQAAPGPEEDVAAELERSAGRAQARGGFAAAAAFLERAAVLTPDLAKRSARALAAAQAKVQAGALDAGLDLLAMAEAGPLGELERARADLVRAQIAWLTGRSRDAPLLVLNAAKRLEPIAPDLARATYVDAIIAAGSAGRFAAPGGSILDVARQVSPVSGHEPTAFDLLLNGMAAQYVQGYTASVPILRGALNAFFDMPAGQEPRGLPLTLMVSSILWDDEACTAVSERWARFCRDAGALSDLLLALSFRTHVLLFAGDLSGAASLVEEVRTATDATGINFQPIGAIALAAFRGNEAEASPFIEANVSQALHRREGNRLAVATWASAVLNNGLGRYQDALAAAQQATDPLDVIHPYWALAELIEAAVRSGTRAAATDAYRRLAEMATATASDWALGVEARSRALLADDDDAEHFYREAIEHLGRTRMRAELARARLLYGEWLRRQRRAGHAREQLRTALGMLEAMGMEGFSERARRELRATGETRARKGSFSSRSELTVQEAQVAKLAREGLSNPEIGARLYISSRTAEYHLSKVFTKLNITSRVQLEHALT
jgi:DNA-binding CsgD family transcriptional regulator